jgi:hypothetical protein
MLNRQFSPDELRRWAAECGKEANNPKTSVSDRQRLFKMQSALIDLALTEEWLHPAVAEPVIVEFILPEEKSSAR